MGLRGHGCGGEEIFYLGQLSVHVHIKMREARKRIMYMCIQDRLGVIHVLSKIIQLKWLRKRYELVYVLKLQIA